MRRTLASRIMRTTIDIDDPILKEVKRLQLREGKSLGRLVSDLLAQSLAATRAAAKAEAPAFQWVAKPMRARLDLADKNALLDAMDERGA
jgi:Arc/MetJ family transcription regulator